MSLELRPLRPESVALSPESRRAAPPAKKESFQQVVAKVLRDSQSKPAEYLDEVVVQKGGE